MVTKHMSINDIQHADSDFGRIVEIPGYSEIVLDGTPGIYKECTSYNTKFYSNLEEYWHQIMVYHGGAYRKVEIFRQFVKYFPNSMFNPVAYRIGRHVDQFLIRLTKAQMNTLFSNQLKLLMHDGKIILLKVKINVAKAHFTHIDPLSKIKNVLNRQLTRCEDIGAFKVLNLNNIYEKTKDIFITMSNVPSFEMICQCLLESSEIKKSIRGFKFQHNSIKSLRPLAVLQKINVAYLDLSGNEIDRIEELTHLKSIGLNVLKIYYNPIRGIKLASQKIREILPDINNIDLPDGKINEKTLVHEKTDPALTGDCYDTGDFILENYMRSNKWHQVIVLHNGRCAKNKILEALFELCDDTEFYPCWYKEEPRSDSFFIRNCLDTINCIKDANLKLTIDGSDQTNRMILPIRLVMNAKDHDPSQMDPVSAISEALNARYDFSEKTLDLAGLSIKTFANELIINIANTKILTQILILAARRFSSSIQHMNLAGNGIKSAKGLFPLLNMKSLTSLNLSDNKIEECEELFTLMVNLKLYNLSLANNPFCKNFDAIVYVKEMKKKFPTLEILDGHTIHENSLTCNKNYLSNLDYYDFIQKFIKNYFQIFDSQMRYKIIDFYHIKAMYSMSMNYTSKIAQANTARINKYRGVSRNILKCSDFRQFAENILIGNKIITSYFSNLPITEHDYNSFSIDVPYADEHMICITLNGALKELGTSLLENELSVGFTRTFVLKAQRKHSGFLNGGIDYTICNEHLHIFGLNIMQLNNVFKNKQPEQPAPGTPAESPTVGLPREIDVKYENECLTKIFMEITKMKMNWSVRCLSRVDRKLLPAVEYFLRLEELQKIPKIAYNHK